MLLTTSAVIWRGALCFLTAALIAWAYGQYIMVRVLTVLEMTDGGGVIAVFVCFLVCYFFLTLLAYILLQMPICKIWT